LLLGLPVGCAASGRAPGPDPVAQLGDGGSIDWGGTGGVAAGDLASFGAGGSGGGGGGGSGGSGGGGPVDQNCPDSAKLVYLLDQDSTMTNFSLLSFQPNAKNISQSIVTNLGPLSCTAALIPNSMSVDRKGIAWVEFVPSDDTITNQDALYNVDTNKATLPCTLTTYRTQSFGTHYGMGFVANAASSGTETLFVATDNAPNHLGTLDTTTLAIAAIGGLNGGPELSGTGDAHLWGFYPDPNTPRVSQIDKVTAMESTTSTYPIAQAMGMEDGYAFAFWGGDFWVFLKKVNETSSTLYHVNGANGMVDTWVMNGHWIIGAGVSTCAPISPIS
jgi:hypothetical protein